MPSTNDASEDDAFLEALDGVQPLRGPKRADLRRPAPPPVPAQRRRDERAALAESLQGPLSIDDALDTGEELSHLRDGLSRDVLRKLRRGHWVVQAELDLHGQTRVQAAGSVALFLRDCAAAGRRCLRIVHGKGLGSRNRQPVLKNLVRKWLQQRDEVLAYCQAPAADGGSGALLVLLKARKQG